MDVAVPGPSARLPGVSMAGFRQRVSTPVEITMIPHPSVTIIVDVSETGDIVHDTDGRRRRGSFAAGLLPGRLDTGGSSGECLQLRLSPVVAATVLDSSPDLTGTVAPLRDVWGPDTEQLEERLRAATSWNDRFAIAADLLRHRLDTRPPVDPEVAHIWRRTVTSRGRLRVDRMAAEVGWSRKRLWSRSRSQLGITPKRAAQLARFDHAAHLLAAGHSPATVAARSGYVDQPHLHREVKAVTGSTPTAVSSAPWLAIDDVAWPTYPRT
ncbi:AraC family transcriptional regulator [Actinophytocola sp. S1-96]|uniref:AraC family transcriptional regulator n=1 Tax=Actinophytocola gossypii TaxID=2812003 RepID=A0ABT2JAD8_9PSEU|nr:AraC family transcriptional regulator [Actinophytocola gossypii]